MTGSSARLTGPILAAVGASVALAWLGMKTAAFTDYEHHTEPAFTAFRAADFAAFLDSLGAYAGTVILRAPFAIVPALWGGEDLAVFRAVAVPCLIAGVVLGVLLFDQSRTRNSSRWVPWTVLALCVANPITLRALEIGHPEELLGSALCIGAVFAAARHRPLVAGLLLGIAIANKPWAVLAVLPVLLILPEGRWRALGVASALAAVVNAPLFLAGGSAIDATAATASTGDISQPWQVWWFLGEHGPKVYGFFAEKPGYRTPPGWIGQVSHPLVLAVAVSLSLLARGRIRAASWHEALLLLSMIFLLRDLLDTANNVYYHLPFLLTLLAWEACAHRGMPKLALAATMLTWTSFEFLPRLVSPDIQSLFYLAWTVPLGIALGWRLLAPATFSRVIDRAKNRLGPAFPTFAGRPPLSTP